jgi:hypothetical protein
MKHIIGKITTAKSVWGMAEMITVPTRSIRL